jgi:two-component system, chemotaxis family, chemotaxis protein CheY
MSVPHTVLVVDDSGLARRSARHILEPAGYAIAEADDGMTALERYFLDRPDVVLLDLVMNGMSGLDVLAKLRQMDPAARVIVVSADVQDSSRQLAMDAGASGFVIKPVDRTALLKTVAEALQGPA